MRVKVTSTFQSNSINWCCIPTLYFFQNVTSNRSDPTANFQIYKCLLEMSVLTQFFWSWNIQRTFCLNRWKTFQSIKLYVISTPQQPEKTS